MEKKPKSQNKNKILVPSIIISLCLFAIVLIFFHFIYLHCTINGITSMHKYWRMCRLWCSCFFPLSFFPLCQIVAISVWIWCVDFICCLFPVHNQIGKVTIRLYIKQFDTQNCIERKHYCIFKFFFYSSIKLNYSNFLLEWVFNDWTRERTRVKKVIHTHTHTQTGRQRPSASLI